MSFSNRFSSMHDLQDHGFPTKSEFWGIRCEAGKRYSQVVKRPFHLTMAALDPEVRGQSTYISLMVERGGCQYLLCNLKRDTILQVNLNLYFDKGEQICFSLKGDATVHLSGYHIDNFEKFNENSKRKSGTAKGSTLNDFELDDSSDDDDVDFEEMLWNEEDQESSEEEDDDEEEDDEEDEEGDDEDEEDEEDEEEEDKNSKKKIEEKSVSPNLGKKQKGSQKRQLDEEDSEDSSDGDSDIIEIVPAKKLSKKEAKKLKMNSSSTPAQNNKVKNQNTPKKLFEDNLDFDGESKKGKNPFTDDLNSSIGRTPMPKKSVSFQSSFKETPGDNNLKNKSPVKKEKQSLEVDGKMNQSMEEKATSEQNTSMTSESKKKKKKKRKSIKGEGDESATPKVNESVAKKTPQKMDGGVEVEDIKVGHGLEAKKGKMVHLSYTGKLDNGLVFDSTHPGSRPFSFKMGTSSVIKGLDIGMQGMKVGGKRRIRIPPAMGYRNQKMGKIPPSSTLNFMVELKAVS